jgi:hypothetical protein
MSQDTLQLIAAAAVVIMEAYAIQPWKFPVFAMFWDMVATICGQLANRLAWVSMNARANYFTAVSNAS